MAAGLNDWRRLAELSDEDLQHLVTSTGVSAQRLRLLRGQARLVQVVGLAPAEAALLLHAGIASPAGLAAANPQQLLVQVGRFQRGLMGRAAPAIHLADVQAWIARARQATN